MKNDFQKIELLPKVELHVHIEGATSPETYFSLAKKNRVKLPCDELNDWKKYFDFKDFKHFIDVYGVCVQTIKKPEDLTLIIEEFYENQLKNNIIYSEAFISASFLVGNFKSQEILDAIQLGMQNGERKHKIKVNLIPDISRHIPSSQNQVLDLAIKGFYRGVFIGLGLGGMEVNYPTNLFTETFAKAKEAGLRIVAHAGEADGPESIWGAIKDLNIERIGHCITCTNDEKLMRYLYEKQIPIEVSPTSNYHLGVINVEEKHPIRKMVDRGLLCTINTDDPLMFSTDISNEFKLLYKQGFSIEELYKLNKNAIASSFLDSKDKSALFKIVNEYEYTMTYKKNGGHLEGDNKL